jgi:hypothetical protein
VTPNSGTATYTVTLSGWNFDNASATNTCIKRANAASPWGIYGTFVSSTSTSPVTCVRSGITGFSQHAIATSIAPLPIELLNFTSECVGPDVKLSWATATETDNDHFDVEKSLDGTRFMTAGTVKGGGNSSIVRNYAFTDYNSYDGVSYYRLKQTDYNGSSQTSNMITAENCSGNNVVNAFNNQEGNIVVDVNAEMSGVYHVTLMDALSNKISSANYTAEKGNNVFLMNISGLNSGIYFIVIDDGKNPVTKKVFIR